MIFKYGRCRSCGKKNQMIVKPRPCTCGADLTLSENWYVKYTHNGTATVKSISSRKRDAEDYMASIKVAVRTKSLLPGEEELITWEEAVTAFKKWIETEAKSDGTRKMYLNGINFLSPYFKSKTLQTITKKDVLDFRSDRMRDKKPSTVNRYLATIKRIYSLHCDWHSARDYPKLHQVNADVVRIKLLDEDNLKTRFLTNDEARKLLEACDDKLRIFVEIGLMTGLRLRNITNMRWEQIHRDTITCVVKGKKTNTIPLHPQLASKLKEWKVKSGLREWVFKTGEYDAAIDIGAKFRDVVRSLGMDDVTPHTLRHTYASHFLMNGGDLATLSELLGHADIGITKKRYGHLCQEHKKKQVIAFSMVV